MNSFLNAKRPILTAMVPAEACGAGIEAVMSSISYGLENGADAFGFQIERLEMSLRTRETFEGVFAAMQGKPAYVTNYRRSQPERSWEELNDELLLLLDAGARLIDIPGDTFCSTEYELTHDAGAIARQRELIREIHARGGEVLMSSHIMEYRSPEQVLDVARAQIERGADIAKIVTNADSDRELFENLRANYLLKEQLGAPFLFLCNGTHAYLHRCFGPSLGSSLFLCVSAPLVKPGVKQPSLLKARAILEDTVPSYNYK